MLRNLWRNSVPPVATKEFSSTKRDSSSSKSFSRFILKLIWHKGKLATPERHPRGSARFHDHEVVLGLAKYPTPLECSSNGGRLTARNVALVGLVLEDIGIWAVWALVGKPSSVEAQDLYDCADFDFQEDAQAVFDRDRGNPYGLDWP